MSNPRPLSLIALPSLWVGRRQNPYLIPDTDTQRTAKQVNVIGGTVEGEVKLPMPLKEIIIDSRETGAISSITTAFCWVQLYR